ncbi:divalent-cation tolerance protein CutA [Allokutzneria sp. A3M-2-11 16]|uniref:divalent-cation tolerance protein CutA n=1 Tax=Allokutzneria sp. A3M-2-11 16 TaxID=2962043 RepID=UPI0020B65D69|nr:divalent-cation tolerance protein CutA [Allokutzneria sp. A3M-2-11 16]MCP3802743.1 divalent-cation tolerance protein CutA [Allokutzneria sp. A3M-2-11 16]
MGHLMVFTTLDSADAAEDLARSLVADGLAACVQVVGPVRSVYRWRGEVCVDQEWQLVIKTAEERMEELSKHVRAHHSYEVPELVAVPITGGSQDYLDWVTEQVSPRG